MSNKIASINLGGVTYDVIQSEDFNESCAKNCDYYIHCTGKCSIRAITSNFQYCKLKIR